MLDTDRKVVNRREKNLPTQNLSSGEGEEEQTIDTIKKMSTVLADSNCCRKELKPGRRIVSLSEAAVVNGGQKKQI